MFKKWKNAVYADTPVNARRQSEVDIAKFVLIFMLALVHCTIECTPEEELVSGIPFLMDSVIGGPLGAPMFMFAMGCGMAFKQTPSSRLYVQRAWHLALIGWGLNIARFIVPYLWAYLLTGDVPRYLESLPYRFFGNDVLQFAALTFLIFALFHKFHAAPWQMLAVGLLFSLAGNAFNGICFEKDWINILMGHLVGVENPPELAWIYSDFPILNWLIVPICGYLFGRQLRYVKNERLFYTTFTPVLALVVILSFHYRITHVLGVFGEGQNVYYHITTVDVLLSIAAAVAAIGLYYALSFLMGPRLLKLIEKISRNINAVYCIHWVFVSIFATVALDVLKGDPYLPIGNTMFLGCAISVLSMALSTIWKDHIRPGLIKKIKG